jgi:hypothetical protein
MKKLTGSDRPERITLDVSGRQVVFVRVTDDRCAVNVPPPITIDKIREFL